MGIGAEMLMEMMIDNEVERMLLERQYNADCELLDKGIWRMRDGRLIRISKMDSSHLRNTIAMLTRNEPHYSELYLELALSAKKKMEAELSRRYQPVDPTEGYFDDSEGCYL